MRKFYISTVLFFALIILCSSCATILNQPIQKVFISTDQHIKSVRINKSLSVDSSLITSDSQKIYYLVRTKKPLPIELQLDSTTKTIFLKSKNSSAYWLNIATNYGIGMLADRNNTKRYGYPERNYFTVKDTTIRRSAFAPIKKGTIDLSLSWALPSFFNLQSASGNYNSSGPMGLHTGIDYFYKSNHYISLNFGAATDMFGEYLGSYRETATTFFTSVQNSNVVGRFDFGYGINLSKFEWNRSTTRDTINLDKSVKSTALGVSLSTQYRFGNYFRLGILYQPDFLKLDVSPALKYQDYISFNLVWKFVIKNPR